MVLKIADQQDNMFRGGETQPKGIDYAWDSKGEDEKARNLDL